MPEKTSISEVKCDVGSFAEHHVVHKLILNKGEDNPEIYKLAWDTFKEATKGAEDLKLHGAGHFNGLQPEARSSR